MEMRKSRGAYVFHLEKHSMGKEHSIPLVSIMGKEHLVLSLSPLSFLFLAIRSVRMGSPSSSPTIDSSNIYGFSPKGSSNSQPSKKREGWLFEVVGVFGRKFPKLSLFLGGMKEVFLFCFVFFQSSRKL